jgi:DNA-binding beta-propeller fold protein YncE
MQYFSVGRLPLGLLFISISLVSGASGQVTESGLLSAHLTSAEPVAPSPAVRALAPPSLQFSYTGSYLADGKFAPVSKKARWYSQVNAVPDDGRIRPAEVPPSVNLHPTEVTVENLLPKLHASKPARGQPFWTAFRDDVVTFAYGHERLIAAPQRVTTDSKGRVIIADPAGTAVHVLSEAQSLRILTGTNRRVQTPSGIAVDAADNIYIADADRGLVAVYDSAGRFLHYVGKVGDESLFYFPTGIAVDHRSGNLYVVDTGRQLIFIMDANGREVRRVGRSTVNATYAELDFPTEVVVGPGGLAILDNGGTRIWLTDLEGNPLNHFSFAGLQAAAKADRPGLAIDAAGNLYVSHSEDGTVRSYDRNGRLLNTLGHTGDGFGQFRIPTGVWIDGNNRMYVSDQYNRRVQTFQMNAPTLPEAMAVGK